MSLLVTNNTQQNVNIPKNILPAESAFWVLRNKIILHKKYNYSVKLSFIFTSLLSILFENILPNQLILNGEIIIIDATEDYDWKYIIEVVNNNITITSENKLIYQLEYDSNRNS